MIKESQKDKALEVIDEYEREQTHQIRESIENDCPSKDYNKGEPNGLCDGDGHYLCQGCTHYNYELWIMTGNKIH